MIIITWYYFSCVMIYGTFFLVMMIILNLFSIYMGVWVDLVTQHRNGMRYDHTYEYIFTILTDLILLSSLAY